ncbi:MAG: sulfotransferase family 2 domain-containing protein [Pseudooceanicola nanhaiensis]
MPVIRIGPKLLYFAHAPKCGGTSVEEYVTERFGPPALLDRRFMLRPEPRWSRSSPQHMDVETFRTLFPEGFFDDVFALVRHPAMRLRSAYGFSRRRIGPGGFEGFLRRIPRLSAKQHLKLDNHFRPMSDIVPNEARIFRLEDGDAGMIAYLDRLADSEDGPRALPHSQKGPQRMRPKNPVKALFQPLARPPIPPLDERLCRMIHDLYAEDYERFGYGWDDPLKTG